MNHENPTAMQSVVLFILERTGLSQLNYADYAIVEQWIQKSQDLDQLLLILSDIIPAMDDKSSRLSLAGFHKKVLRQLSISMF